MNPADSHVNEHLGTLSQLDVLEADPEEAFDRITALARRIFGVSTVTVNLVAEERQWFKAAAGVDLDDPDRGTAFGAYALLDGGVVIVEDATQDDRFANHPLIDDGQTPRFFAAAPLVVDDDHRVGALCLSDDHPRPFDETDREILSLLADVAADTLETRRHAHQIDYLVSALEEIDESVVITEGRPIDPPGPRIVWVNEACTRLTGYDRTEMIGKSLRILQGPETDSLAQVWAAMKAEQSIQVECLNYPKEGDPYVAAWNVTPVRDEEGRVTHWVFIQRDITDQKRREEKLAYEAAHDGLTDLYNRTALARTVNEVLSSTRRSRDPLRALMYLDLDNFKTVNDTFGHDRGDEVLVRTARALESAVRSDDMVARIGGDEFAVYLSSLDAPSTAPAIAERIHEALETTITTNGREIPVSVSLGMVVGLSDYDSFEEILQAADAAMYEAKKNGRRTAIHDVGPA